MIPSSQSEFHTGGTNSVLSARPFPEAHQARLHRGHAHLAFGAWPSMSLAEPDIDSLWDNSLLDRLSSPITRYHE
jgi:hypothetical protein